MEFQKDIGPPSYDTLPSYDDCVSDLPPDYTQTDALARMQALYQIDHLRERSQKTSKDQKLWTDGGLLQPKVDFSSSEHFRSHVSKKDKKAAKAKKQAAWGDEDNEGEKPAGEGGEENGGNGGGEGGGDGAGGAGGGDGGDGGDGDDWDAWGTGKKKKKGKKKQQEEEEEQRRKEEEEQKKKEEEEAAAAAGMGDSAWTDKTGDAAADDGWGDGFATAGSKKKKGKKGKVRVAGSIRGLLAADMYRTRTQSLRHRHRNRPNRKRTKPR